MKPVTNVPADVPIRAWMAFSGYGDSTRIEASPSRANCIVFHVALQPAARQR
jgi:hypothetical protein